MNRVHKVPSEETLIGHLGQELLEVGPQRATGRMVVADYIKQPLGLVHGGALISLAETLASTATAQAVSPENRVAVGQEINASLIRPIASGTVHGEARCRRQGNSAWIWEVEITDDDGNLCALVRCTIAVRPL